MHAILN